MPKKSTHWITIPEEKLHTPGSKGAAGPKKGEPKKSQTFVKNKLFWGAAFIVVVIAAFAMLAPAQFSALLQGRLFDVTGIEDESGALFEEAPEEAGISPETLLVPGQAEEEAEEVAEEVDEEPEEEGFEPLVQPEEEPIAIAVEPVSVPEEVEVEPEAEEPDAQAELIAELTKQLEDLQKQREQDMQALQDLTKLIQEGARPAAPAIQPPVQPGFRANPYRVTIAPEEVLRQNLARGVQITQPIAAPAPTYQVQAEVTPETGPSEIMIIGFIITFLALLGWKFVRTVIV